MFGNTLRGALPCTVGIALARAPTRGVGKSAAAAPQASSASASTGPPATSEFQIASDVFRISTSQAVFGTYLY